MHINLMRLKTWDDEDHDLTVVIETPKGTRSKLNYEPVRGIFMLGKVLPLGTVFPFDFGFVPSTLGEDGDPLDVLVIMDESIPPGCVLACRLLGVIKATQEADGETMRNDRLVVAPHHSKNCAEIHHLKELDPALLQEIEHFFASYNEMEGKVFKPIGRAGPRHAKKLIWNGQRRLGSDKRGIRKG